MGNKRLAVITLLTMLFLSACSHHGYSQQGRDDDDYSRAELDQLLAPIALYPDELLSQILMAATYPLEVVEAARWSADHPRLDGSEAVAAVEHRDWDPSVKALAAFPSVLERMDKHLEWTQQLGDAYLLQEGDVIDSIQRLRRRAEDNGYLANSEHAHIHHDRDVILIEPANPRLIYVPYYHPLTVYPNWWWPDYPPHYWGLPPGLHSSIGFYWGRGVSISTVFFASTFHWHDRHIVVLNPRHSRARFTYGVPYSHYRGAAHWRHDPIHRRGVHYPRNWRPHYGFEDGRYDNRHHSQERLHRNRDGGAFRHDSPASRMEKSPYSGREPNELAPRGRNGQIEKRHIESFGNHRADGGRKGGRADEALPQQEFQPGQRPGKNSRGAGQNNTNSPSQPIIHQQRAHTKDRIPRKELHQRNYPQDRNDAGLRSRNNLDNRQLQNPRQGANGLQAPNEHSRGRPEEARDRGQMIQQNPNQWRGRADDSGQARRALSSGDASPSTSRTRGEAQSRTGPASDNTNAFGRSRSGLEKSRHHSK